MRRSKAVQHAARRHSRKGGVPLALAAALGAAGLALAASPAEVVERVKRTVRSLGDAGVGAIVKSNVAVDALCGGIACASMDFLFGIDTLKARSLPPFFRPQLALLCGLLWLAAGRRIPPYFKCCCECSTRSPALTGAGADRRNAAAERRPARPVRRRWAERFVSVRGELKPTPCALRAA